MYTQRRYDNKSTLRNVPWRIDWDLPEALQFCSYVGQVHDFRPDATIGKIQPIKREWIDWCKQLFSVFASRPMSSSGVLPSSMSAFQASGYEPPYFPELANHPHLQTACREHWPHFDQIWNGSGGGRRQLSQQLSQMVQQLDLNELVQKCMQHTGTSGSVAFTLQIGIVRWPEDFRQRLSKDCVVIGSAYLEREQRQALISLLQTQICDLISAKN